MAARVLVVDSHPVTRWGVCAVLSQHDDLEVVGQAGSAAEAVSMTAALLPDVVVIGLTSDDAYGLPVATELRDRFDDLGLVLLSAVDGDEIMLQAFDSGLSACLPKSAPVPEVVAAVRHAAVFATSFTAAGLSAALLRRAAVPKGDLSAREREVLALLVAGGSVPDLAARLHLSQSTVKTYVARVYDKLGARNRAEAVMAAVRLGLTGPAATGDLAVGAP
jgi:DNA-binding NarL/FixJ family response regulator